VGVCNGFGGRRIQPVPGPAHDTCDAVVDFVNRWSGRTEIAVSRLVCWLGRGAIGWQGRRWMTFGHRIQMGYPMNHTTLLTADYFLNEQTCPICNRQRKLTKKRTLYGYPVCKRCRNGFANRRQAAFITDIVAVQLAMWCMAVALALVPVSTMNVWWVGQTCAYITFWILFTCKDGFSGMSPGKWLFGVQVVDAKTREPISFKASAKRNVTLVIPYINWIFWLIAVVQMMLGPRIGDGWAKTVVIWRKHTHKPPFDPRGIYCLVCGYNLTGNTSGICPECGTSIPQQIKSILETMTATAYSGHGNTTSNIIAQGRENNPDTFHPSA